MSMHPDVSRCVVVPSENRLIAYIVAPGIRAEPSSLTTWLASQVPSPMVPDHVVLLDAIPLSANGKVDRAALPVPNPVRRPSRTVAPRDRLEERVLEIWMSLLPESLEVGVCDDFFDIGGHSLLAIQAISRLRRNLGAELSVRDFFEAPSVAELAALITTRLAETQPADLVASTVAQIDAMDEEEVKRRLEELKRGIAPGD